MIASIIMDIRYHIRKRMEKKRELQIPMQQGEHTFPQFSSFLLYAHVVPLDCLSPTDAAFQVLRVWHVLDIERGKIGTVHRENRALLLTTSFTTHTANGLFLFRSILVLCIFFSFCTFCSVLSLCCNTPLHHVSSSRKSSFTPKERTKGEWKWTFLEEKDENVSRSDVPFTLRNIKWEEGK